MTQFIYFDFRAFSKLEMMYNETWIVFTVEFSAVYHFRVTDFLGLVELNM